LKKVILAICTLICCFTTSAQSSNESLINKLTHIENDTSALLEIIDKPYLENGAYNDGIDKLEYSIANKSDTFVLKKTLNRIIQTNNDIFLKRKIYSVLLFNIEHSGESSFYNDILLIKTDSVFYGFFSSNDNKIYKKIISKKNYKYAKITMLKRYPKEGLGETLLIREITQNKKTKAKLIVVNYKVAARISIIEDYFKDIIPLN
jgi:hypothetical protein